jgi:hypothetical protein
MSNSSKGMVEISFKEKKAISDKKSMPEIDNSLEKNYQPNQITPKDKIKGI